MAIKMLQFPEELITEMFDTVNGKSTVAALAASRPIPFSGTKEFVFSLDGDVSIVGEGNAKPAETGGFEPVVINPIKMVYQLRVTNEFMYAADEARLGYLQAFADGFAKKMARGLDIAAIHGLNPKTRTPATVLAGKSFDAKIQNIVTYDASAPDDNLDAAIQMITANSRNFNGLAISDTFGAAMARVKVNGVVQYPEFRFGGAPASFAGMPLSKNSTLIVTDSTSGASVRADHAIVGDFQGAFRWGYAKNVPLEVIEYGDPDNSGRDLKAYNEVCLRAEAFVGFGILDADSFAMIKAAATTNA